MKQSGTRNDDKVRAYRVGGKPETTLDARVSSQELFGLRVIFRECRSKSAAREAGKPSKTCSFCFVMSL
jgi:hypothetical protein